MGNWRGAMAMLDTTHTPAIDKQRAVLDIQRGDLHIIAGRYHRLRVNFTTMPSQKNWAGNNSMLAYAPANTSPFKSEFLWRNYIENSFTIAHWDHKKVESWLSQMASQYPHPPNGTFYPTAFSLYLLLADAQIQLENCAMALSPIHY